MFTVGLCFKFNFRYEKAKLKSNISKKFQSEKAIGEGHCKQKIKTTEKNIFLKSILMKRMNSKFPTWAKSQSEATISEISNYV